MSVLVLKQTGCCAGHPCDNCTICQSGRCCRRDNPDYKLPELGEWDGTIYGELGVLNDDGEKVECHCCGEWFVRLSSHFIKTHNLTDEEYRAIFGLGRRTALMGPTLRAVLRSKDMHGLLRGGLSWTPEQRSDFSSRPKRLEVKRSLSSKMKEIKSQRRGQRISEFRGVTPQKQRRDKWRAALTHNGKYLYMGIFDTQEEAARAYDAKARELYGNKARLNFPEQV